MILTSGLIVGITGCGDPLNRQAVSGAVSYQGKPIAIGSVTFNPTDPASKTTGGAAINDGKYEILQETGLSPGTYRVSFTAMDKQVFGPAVPGDAMPAAKDMAKEILPAKDGAKSTIEVEVTSGGDNVFDFKLD